MNLEYKIGFWDLTFERAKVYFGLFSRSLHRDIQLVLQKTTNSVDDALKYGNMEIPR